MKKVFAATIISITAVFANVALAAPPARGASNLTCAHCVTSGTMAVQVANTRGTAMTQGVQPCRHATVATVRWGNSPVPCAHCNHAL